MKQYLKTLIEEKGKSLDDEIKIEGHIGLTYEHLADFIDTAPEFHSDIKNTLVKIDFHNGDVFHYLDHLANAMVKAMGY
jgi:hypothetical protein